MCMWWTLCIPTCLCVCVCERMWRPEIDRCQMSGIILGCSFTLFVEAGFLNQTQSSLIQLCHLCIPIYDGGLPHPPSISLGLCLAQHLSAWQSSPRVLWWATSGGPADLRRGKLHKHCCAVGFPKTPGDSSPHKLPASYSQCFQTHFFLSSSNC